MPVEPNAIEPNAANDVTESNTDASVSPRTPPKLVKVVTPVGLYQRAAHAAVDEGVSVPELYRKALRAYLAPSAPVGR